MKDENKKDPKEHPVQKVTSGLAIALLKKNLKKGKVIEIPSLNIRFDKDGIVDGGAK